MTRAREKDNTNLNVDCILETEAFNLPNSWLFSDWIKLIGIIFWMVATILVGPVSLYFLSFRIRDVVKEGFHSLSSVSLISKNLNGETFEFSWEDFCYSCLEILSVVEFIFIIFLYGIAQKKLNQFQPIPAFIKDQRKKFLKKTLHSTVSFKDMVEGWFCGTVNYRELYRDNVKGRNEYFHI